MLLMQALEALGEESAEILELFEIKSRTALYP